MWNGLGYKITAMKIESVWFVIAFFLFVTPFDAMSQEEFLLLQDFDYDGKVDTLRDRYFGVGEGQIILYKDINEDGAYFGESCHFSLI